jgi:hypothetical protein
MADIEKLQRDPAEYEFERHDPRFDKHDVKVKRKKTRGAKAHRNPMPVRPPEQEER